MPNTYKKRTSEEPKQSICEKLMTKKLIKRVLSIKLRTWLLIIFFILLIPCVFIVYQYSNLPYHFTDTDKLAHTVINNVFEENYEGGNNPTREQVLQIIYGVFSGLRMENFKDPKDAEEVFNWARSEGVLKGRRDGFWLDQAATKQQSLVFIGRSLGIMDEIDAGKEPPSVDADDWAKPQINGLVFQEYLFENEIGILGDLREPITVSELEGLLNQIVKHKTRPVKLDEFATECVELWVKNHPILTLFWKMLTAFSTIMGTINSLVWLHGKKAEEEQEEREKQRRKGTIYLTGISDVGKATLKKQMIEAYGLKYEQRSTKECNKDRIVLRSQNGDVLFDGKIIVVQAHELRNIIDSDRENIILLLVLAHTKGDYGREIDRKFIKDQRCFIENTCVRIIQESGNLNKLIVMINKTDLLSEKILHGFFRSLSFWWQNFINSQKNYGSHSSDIPPIYKKHMKVLNEAAEERGGGFIRVVKGSATSEASLSKLHQELCANLPGSRSSE